MYGSIKSWFKISLWAYIINLMLSQWTVLQSLSFTSKRILNGIFMCCTWCLWVLTMNHCVLITKWYVIFIAFSLYDEEIPFESMWLYSKLLFSLRVSCKSTNRINCNVENIEMFLLNSFKFLMLLSLLSSRNLFREVSILPYFSDLKKLLSCLLMSSQIKSSPF